MGTNVGARARKRQDLGGCTTVTAASPRERQQGPELVWRKDTIFSSKLLILTAFQTMELKLSLTISL